MLGEIAERFDVTVEQLQAWNHDSYPSLATNPDRIEVGWVIELTGPPDATVPPQPTQDPTPQPTPEPTPEPTPGADLYVDDYCTVRDWLTPYRSYDQHHVTVLDWTYMVGPDYVPPDLVSTARAGFAGVSGEKLIRSIVLTDLAALREAAAADGHAIEVQSAYRSYQTQADTFAYWVEQAGYEQALDTSARPGHSQHQLGTTIDFTSGATPPWQYADWGATPAGAWMAENAWRYGWVRTYPPGSEDVACYTYEPWHYRWVGREMAADWRASGLVFHEYQVRLGERLAR